MSIISHSNEAIGIKCSKLNQKAGMPLAPGKPVTNGLHYLFASLSGWKECGCIQEMRGWESAKETIPGREKYVGRTRRWLHGHLVWVRREGRWLGLEKQSGCWTHHWFWSPEQCGVTWALCFHQGWHSIAFCEVQPDSCMQRDEDKKKMMGKPAERF